MNDEEIFKEIEEESNLEKIHLDNIEEQNTENPFVTGLPNWDLEPPYEPIKRGNQQ